MEQKHNHFAMLLLALYLPAWYGIIYGLTDNASIGFKLRAFNVFVATSQHRLGLLTGMLNATTLIMGFVALTGVRRSAPVDRRLVLCGYSRAGLITGRFAALAVASTLVAVYAVAVLAADADRGRRGDRRPRRLVAVLGQPGLGGGVGDPGAPRLLAPHPDRAAARMKPQGGGDPQRTAAQCSG